MGDMHERGKKGRKRSRETGRGRMKAGEKFVLNITEGGVHFPESLSWWLTQGKDMISTERSVHKK